MKKCGCILNFPITKPGRLGGGPVFEIDFNGGHPNGSRENVLAVKGVELGWVGSCPVNMETHNSTSRALGGMLPARSEDTRGTCERSTAEGEV